MGFGKMAPDMQPPPRTVVHPVPRPPTLGQAKGGGRPPSISAQDQQRDPSNQAKGEEGPPP